MHRFFVDTLSNDAHAGHELALDREQSHHAQKVLRLQVGDALMLGNGQGLLAEAVLSGFAGRQALVNIQHVDMHRPDAVQIDLAVAAAKGPRTEQMVSQLTQLGVNRLYLLKTARGVVQPGQGKMQRLERVVIESTKQCGRAYLMQLAGLVTLPHVLAQAYDLCLLAHPTGQPHLPAPPAPPGPPGSGPLSSQQLGNISRLLVLIGPEGGFTDEEVHQAQQAGAVPWCLNPHILRIETAATAAAAILRQKTAPGQ